MCKNKRGKNSDRFPQKIYRLLMKESEEAKNLICWSEDGKSFLVNTQKNHELPSTVLYKGFKLQKYNSFVRQLNFYGFTKTTFNENWSEFRNENFYKGGEDVLHLVVKNKYKTQKSKKECQSKDQLLQQNILPPVNRLQPMLLQIKRQKQQEVASSSTYNKHGSSNMTCLFSTSSSHASSNQFNLLNPSPTSINLCPYPFLFKSESFIFNLPPATDSIYYNNNPSSQYVEPSLTSQNAFSSITPSIYKNKSNAITQSQTSINNNILNNSNNRVNSNIREISIMDNSHLASTNSTFIPVIGGSTKQEKRTHKIQDQGQIDDPCEDYIHASEKAFKKQQQQL